MNDEPIRTSNTPRDQRNVSRYIKLSFLWALVFVTCSLLLASNTITAFPLKLLVALLPSLVAYFSARAYWRYLDGMDELLRTIELRALALCVAAGFVVWPAMELITHEVIPGIHVPVTLLVMTGFYVYGLMKGRRAHL